MSLLEHGITLELPLGAQSEPPPSSRSNQTSGVRCVSPCPVPWLVSPHGSGRSARLAGSGGTCARASERRDKRDPTLVLAANMFGPRCALDPKGGPIEVD
jgi:hypothetical protein